MASESNDTRVAPMGARDDASPGRGSLSMAGRLRRIWWAPVGLIAVVGIGLSIPVTATSLHPPSPSEGLICSNGTASTLAGAWVTSTAATTYAQASPYSATDSTLSMVANRFTGQTVASTWTPPAVTSAPASSTYTATTAGDSTLSMQPNVYAGDAISSGASSGTVQSNTATIVTLTSAGWTGGTPTDGNAFAIASPSPVTSTGVVQSNSATTVNLAATGWSRGVPPNGTAFSITSPQVTSRSFVLTAKPGYISTPDGNSIYMWSYAEGNNDFQYPGPFLCANEGDQVTVTLHNKLPNSAATSVVFTGVPGVKVDGNPTQPNVGPTTSLTQPVANGDSATYTFTAVHPGTFLYESGTDYQLQVQMGLVGGLVVRPFTPASQCGGANPNPNCAYSYTTPASCSNPYGGAPRAYAYDNAYSAYDACEEYTSMLSEIDPDLHHWIELGNASYDWSKYDARYYMINGRSFPDDISPNGISNLPTQPYGALVHVEPRDTNKTLSNGSPNPDYNPDPALIRYLNVGPVAYPFHPHSNHDSTLGIDGHEMVNAAGQDTSFERFGIVVAPGQTIDAVFTWVDAQKWDPASNPVQVPVPDQQDRFEGTYWNGSPYLGDLEPLATGIVRYNECGELMHVAHSHALFQLTNFGFSGGGMLTMVRVDPPPSMQARYGTHCTLPGK